MNKLNIEVWDVVTWGCCTDNVEVVNVTENGVTTTLNAIPVLFSEPNLKIVKKFAKKWRVKDEYIKSFSRLVFYNDLSKADLFSIDSYSYNRLKEAQVLDIWCEKVYEDFTHKEEDEMLKELIYVPDSLKTLEEKYGIELINKEMWCWGSEKDNVIQDYIFYIEDSNLPYIGLNGSYKNASENNPNEIIDCNPNEVKEEKAFTVDDIDLLLSQNGMNHRTNWHTIRERIIQTI